MTDDTIAASPKFEADKFEHHYRQQLSALMDGALPPDEARFLLRRLQHDAELAGCLDRWHMAGDALRGQTQAIVSADFAERVSAMVASEPAMGPAAVGASRANRSGLRWAGGTALAASVALVALFATRQLAAPESMQAPSTIADASIPSRVGNMPESTKGASATMVASPAITTSESIPVAVIATASTPVRSSIRRGNRSQSQRATLRTPARLERPMVAAATTLQSENVTMGKVFDTPAISRPWPSAVFAQAPATGSFNVDYGTASSPTFYPFAPRLPDGQPRDSGETHTVDGSPSP